MEDLQSHLFPGYLDQHLQRKDKFKMCNYKLNSWFMTIKVEIHLKTIAFNDTHSNFEKVLKFKNII